MESWKADEKQIDEVKSEERKSEDEVESEERRCNSAKVRRKKIHPRQMLEKSRNAVFFQWFVCRVSRKVGSLKRRVRSHVVRGEIKNCTPLWREARFQVKMIKNWHSQTTFWSWDVEKLHAVVASQVKMYKTLHVRTTFWSWDVEKLHAAVARKCTKHISSGPLFEVQMLKNRTLLWREAHFQVKMYKTLHVRTTFWSWDVEKLYAAVARSTFPSQNVQNTCVLPHFLKFRCRKISQVVS